MSYPPSGPFHLALKKIPLMRVAYRIGVFIRNYMIDYDQITAARILKRQEEVFEDFSFTETFEVIMLLFMLSRYNYLDYSERHYYITPKLEEEFPLLDEWITNHDSYLSLLRQLECEDSWREILFRRRTWVYQGRLINLDLHDLMITELEVDVFNCFPDLERLDLHKNLLYTLPGDIFSGIPHLTKLDLSNNMITRLPIYLFSNNRMLKSINLGNNGIDNRWLIKFKALNRLNHSNLEIII